MEDTAEAEDMADPGVAGGGGGMAFVSAAAAAAVSTVGGMFSAHRREQLTGRVKALSLGKEDVAPEFAVVFVGPEF